MSKCAIQTRNNSDRFFAGFQTVSGFRRGNIHPAVKTQNRRVSDRLTAIQLFPHISHTIKRNQAFLSGFSGAHKKTWFFLPFFHPIKGTGGFPAFPATIKDGHRRAIAIPAILTFSACFPVISTGLNSLLSGTRRKPFDSL